MSESRCNKPFLQYFYTMIIEFSLSAPDQSHLVDDYHLHFDAGVWYKMEWTYPEMPRAGEMLDTELVFELLHGRVDTTLLPRQWSIVGVLWLRENGMIVPKFQVVGK